MKFQLGQFPGYRIRNVERDTIIADTGATTYVWGKNPSPELTKELAPPAFQTQDCCSMCRAGPFMAAEDREKHHQSKRHQTMQAFEEAWIREIGKQG